MGAFFIKHFLNNHFRNALIIYFVGLLLHSQSNL